MGGWSAAASCCDTAAQIGMVLFENERVLVSASPDMLVQNKILGLYKLYVNGIVVGVGPGRGDAHQTPTPGRGDNAVYDDIQVPLEVLERGAGTNCTLCV